MISKIIHQIWLQGQNNMPEKFLKKVNKIKNFHLLWKYYFWDDIAIINLLSKNKEWIETYYKLLYLHQKVDYAKYVILYEYGGVYIDIDVEIVKPLDNLLQNNSEYDLIVSRINLTTFESLLYCNRNICINNGIILANPKEITLEKIINNIIKNPTTGLPPLIKFSYINNTTGPKMFTKLILNNNNNKIKILEPEFLEPLVLGTGDITDNTYAIHEHNGSWVNESFKKFSIFYIQNKNFIFLFYIIIIFSVLFFLI